MVAAFLLPTWRRAVWSPRPTTHKRLYTRLPGLRGRPCCAAVSALSPPTRALWACPTSCGWTQIYSGSRLRACRPRFPQHEVYGRWGPCQALRAEGGKVSCRGGGRAPSGGHPLSPGDPLSWPGAREAAGHGLWSAGRTQSSAVAAAARAQGAEREGG